MFRAEIIRSGKWQGNLYQENKTYGDFEHLKDIIKWIKEESIQFRGGWEVIKVNIYKKF